MVISDASMHLALVVDRSMDDVFIVTYGEGQIILAEMDEQEMERDWFLVDNIDGMELAKKFLASQYIPLSSPAHVELKRYIERGTPTPAERTQSTDHRRKPPVPSKAPAPAPKPKAPAPAPAPKPKAPKAPKPKPKPKAPKAPAPKPKAPKAPKAPKPKPKPKAPKGKRPADLVARFNKARR